MSDTTVTSPRRHWEMLAISCVVVVCAFLFRVSDDGERVFVSGPWAVPLPPTCFSREALGIPCPGCGLTRSFVHLAHGHWRESWDSHHVGWLLALATVAQIPYRLCAVRCPDRPILPVRAAKAFGGVLITLLIANWTVGWFVTF
jgi:hypothetical protein